MIRLLVKDVAEREGIASAYELSNLTGIHVTSMYKIWNGTARMIGLETLDKLSTVLNVKPGQLFEHAAEPEKLPQRESKRSARPTGTKLRRAPK